MTRKLEIVKGNLLLRENVELIYEKRITRFGNSAKV
ncbi:MAG: DUF2080 family transposase-associated protein, partial [Candidatus Aenigmarchaeota archaeon]|nr:DUF2080 family transposase-associated protein [Candidatus Aenigmarchaeota archaeon]